MQVVVRDNNIDQALKALKKKLQREGVFREMKLRRHYEKPSERRAREAAEAVRRARKVERKRLEVAARKAYATDLATGLPNHAQLMEHMTHLLALREREPAPMVLLVLMAFSIGVLE